MEKQRELTEKQSRFVQEYLTDCNSTAAAARAGYSDASYGRQLRKLPHVSAAIEEGQVEVAERTALTQEEVIEGLRNEATREGDGSSHAARVTAWTQLGRHLGMFKDKVEATVTDTTPRLIINLTGPDDPEGE